MKIEKGRRVRLKIHLAVVGGDTLEKSTIEYIHGGGTMLPGIEDILVGLEKGAKRDGTLVAAKAFGDKRQHPKKSISRTEFPKDAEMKAGDRFMAKGPDGQDIILEVDAVTKTTVEVRFVPALADKDLRYELEVVAVTDPLPPPVPAAALKLKEE